MNAQPHRNSNDELEREKVLSNSEVDTSILFQVFQVSENKPYYRSLSEKELSID